MHEGDHAEGHRVPLHEEAVGFDDRDHPLAGGAREGRGAFEKGREPRARLSARGDQRVLLALVVLVDRALAVRDGVRNVLHGEAVEAPLDEQSPGRVPNLAVALCVALLLAGGGSGGQVARGHGGNIRGVKD